jgi:6,7-dimethyl-8-ribityllumazine synthase
MVRAVPKSKHTLDIAIVAADFHAALTEAMLEAAADEAARQGARIVLSVRVPGCYETPLVAEHVLKRRDVAALVVLGCIERGETLHGEVMGHVVHRALVEASLRHEKPVGLGIIGPGATPKQAETRKDASARAAVRAVVRALDAAASVRVGRKKKR